MATPTGSLTATPTDALRHTDGHPHSDLNRHVHGYANSHRHADSDARSTKSGSGNSWAPRASGAYRSTNGHSHVHLHVAADQHGRPDRDSRILLHPLCFASRLPHPSRPRSSLLSRKLFFACRPTRPCRLRLWILSRLSCFVSRPTHPHRPRSRILSRPSLLRVSTNTIVPTAIKPTASPVGRFVATIAPAPTVARPVALPTLRLPANQPLPTLPVVVKPAVPTPTSVYTLLPTPTGTLTSTLTESPQGAISSEPLNVSPQRNDRTRQGISGVLNRRGGKPEAHRRPLTGGCTGARRWRW